MNAALLLAALLVLGFAVVALPTAAACPDPDNPCDPLPLCTSGAVACAKQVVGCVEDGAC